MLEHDSVVVFTLRRCSAGKADGYAPLSPPCGSCGRTLVFPPPTFHCPARHDGTNETEPTPSNRHQIYRILPYREAILEGVLSSDIIGFQTYDYARHFLSTVESLLDANCSPQVRVCVCVCGCFFLSMPCIDCPRFWRLSTLFRRRFLSVHKRNECVSCRVVVLARVCSRGTSMDTIMHNLLSLSARFFYFCLLRCEKKGVEHNGHFANVTICPVGIDPDAVSQLCNEPDVMGLMQRWSKQTRVRERERERGREGGKERGRDGERGGGERD